MLTIHLDLASDCATTGSLSIVSTTQKHDDQLASTSSSPADCVLVYDVYIHPFTIAPALSLRRVDQLLASRMKFQDHLPSQPRRTWIRNSEWQRRAAIGDKRPWMRQVD